MKSIRRIIQKLLFPPLPPDPFVELENKLSDHFDRIRALENRVSVNEAILVTTIDVLSESNDLRGAFVNLAHVFEAKAAEWDARIEDRAAAFYGDDEIIEPAAAMASGFTFWAIKLRTMTGRDDK